jgi:hypothetical protein
MGSFRTIRTSGVARAERDAPQLPWQRKLPSHTARARAAVTEGSRRRADRDSLVSVRRGHAGQVVQRPGGSRPGEPRHDPGSAWRLLVSSGPASRGNGCLDYGCESGWAGDERGQDADPPVHAVRVRDVLQLDGLVSPDRHRDVYLASPGRPCLPAGHRVSGGELDGLRRQLEPPGQVGPSGSPDKLRIMLQLKSACVPSSHRSCGDASAGQPQVPIPKGMPSRYQATKNSVQTMVIAMKYGSMSAITVPIPERLS